MQRMQFIVIRQHQELIKEEIAVIEREKQLKYEVIADKKLEREAIEKDRIKQELIYRAFKQEEEIILAK